MLTVVKQTPSAPCGRSDTYRPRLRRTTTCDPPPDSARCPSLSAPRPPLAADHPAPIPPSACLSSTGQPLQRHRRPAVQKAFARSKAWLIRDHLHCRTRSNALLHRTKLGLACRTQRANQESQMLPAVPCQPATAARHGVVPLRATPRTSPALATHRARRTPYAESCSRAGPGHRVARHQRCHPPRGRLVSEHLGPDHDERCFGPNTISSVPKRRGKFMIASTASRPPQATRTSANADSVAAAASS